MSRALLELDSEDLQRVLLAHARKDSAPSGARERVLAGVGAAALWPSVASASSAGSSSTAGKIGAWLAAKWLVIGLGSGVLTLSAAEVISGPSAPSSPSIERTLSATANPVPRWQAAPLADAEASPRPAPAVAPAPSASAVSASASAAKLDLLAAARSSNTDTRAFAESREPSSLPSVVNFQVGTVASAANDSPQLTHEVRALEAARAALAHGAAAHAFELLNDYAQAFPSGALRVEAAALYLETVAKQGNRKRALELAEQFLTHHPESPLASRVHALAESYRPSLHNR